MAWSSDHQLPQLVKTLQHMVRLRNDRFPPDEARVYSECIRHLPDFGIGDPIANREDRSRETKSCYGFTLSILAREQGAFVKSGIFSPIVEMQPHRVNLPGIEPQLGGQRQDCLQESATRDRHVYSLFAQTSDGFSGHGCHALNIHARQSLDRKST